MKAKKILAMLLSLTMIFALTVPALADTVNEAKIGGNEYSTLAEAITAASENDTVTLLKDVTLSETLVLNKSINLDLNNNTLSKSLETTTDKTPVIKALSGTVVIKNGEITYDASTYTGTTATSNANVINVGMNMSNGVYSGGDCNLTLNGVEVSTVFPKGKQLSMIYVEGGRINVIDSVLSATNVSGNTSPQYIIYTTTNSNAPVDAYVSLSGSTTIDTNSSAGIHAIWLQNANDILTISGDGVTIDADTTWKPNSYTTSYGYAVNNQSGATCTIEGGKFAGKVWQTKGTIDVSGGYFSYAQGTSGQKNKVTVAEGLEYRENTDPETMEAYPYVVAAAVPNVAQIGDNEYPTLADAIAAVPTDGTETTITMIGNEEIETTATGNVVTVESGKNIVLDLNGYTISGTSTQKSNYFIANYGTLEVKDSSANESGKITFQAVADSGYSVENVTVLNEGGTLTLSSGIIENTTNGGLSYAVKNSSNAWANSIISTFNMTGGILRGAKTDNTLRVYQNTGVSWKVNSKNYVNISGGAIENGIFIDTFLHTKDQDLEGYTADDITKGAVIDTEINISGGTVNGLIDMKMRHPFSTELNITGGDFTNAKLRVRKYTSEYGANAKAGTLAEPSAPVVNISGGNFTFADVNNAFLTANWTSYDNAYSITGGTYNFAPTTYVADGYTAVDNNNGTYTVLPAVTYVAQTGGVKYETLAAAIEAAEVGGTVTLLTDIDITSTINITKSLTIDGNNKTINVTGGAGGYGIYIKDESTGSLTVDISDLTLNTTGYQVALMLNSDFGSEVNIENVDINCDGECIYSNGLGTVTATGCDFSHTGTYAPGKDAVYYSALIVGYGGEIIAENCTVTSFGNGAATFPSGGTITLTNTDITINEDTESETNAGYAMWSRNEDYTNYPEYCRDSVITFNSGSVYGDFKITDKYTSGAKNLYDPVIVIKGGIFSEDPSAYVATGYEAVAIDEDPYFFEVVPATPTATVGMSITLEDNIVVNFFVSELSHSPARYTVNYRFEGGTATEANLGEVVEYESGIYRFAVATATAKQMTDKVYFDVYADDTLIKTVTYSIAQYCDTQTSTSADTELVELCKATSTFGAKAQAYFNYKTGNAPVDYSEEFDASEIPSASEYAAEKSAAVTYPVSASLNLLSKTELNFYIYNTASYYEIYGVEEKLSDSDSWNNITVSQERNNDGKMKVTIPGVSPDRLDNTYRLHIASDEYVTYSPLTYVTRHANDGDALGALCQSLYFYYKTARDYTTN